MRFLTGTSSVENSGSGSSSRSYCTRFRIPRSWEQPYSTSRLNASSSLRLRWCLPPSPHFSMASRRRSTRTSSKSRAARSALSRSWSRRASRTPSRALPPLPTSPSGFTSQINSQAPNSSAATTSGTRFSCSARASWCTSSRRTSSRSIPRTTRTST